MKQVFSLRPPIRVGGNLFAVIVGTETVPTPVRTSAVTRGEGHVAEGSGRGSLPERRLRGEQGCLQEPEEEEEKKKPCVSSKGGKE